MSVPKPLDSDEEYISKLGGLTHGADVNAKEIATMLGPTVSVEMVKEAIDRVRQVPIHSESDDDFRQRVIQAVFTPLGPRKRKESVVAAKQYVKKIAIGTLPALEGRVDSGVKGIGTLCDQYKAAKKKQKPPFVELIFAQQKPLKQALGEWYAEAEADPPAATEKLRAWQATLESKIKLLDKKIKKDPKLTIITEFESFLRKLSSKPAYGYATHAKRVEYDDMIGDIDGYQYSVGGIGSVGTSARGVVGYYDPYYANNGGQIESVMLFATVAVLFIVLMCAFCIASAVFGFIMGFIVKKRNERKGAESEVFSDEMRV